MRELPFYTNWSYAHPRAIELAAEVASLAPGDLNRVFFCSGGSEAVESAWKLARQYHAARGERRWKAISRRVASGLSSIHWRIASLLGKSAMRAKLAHQGLVVMGPWVRFQSARVISR